MQDNVRQIREKGGESEKITINLGYVDLGRIDLLVQEGFYSNRTDFIRTAIRNQLAEQAEPSRSRSRGRPSSWACAIIAAPISERSRRRREAPHQGGRAGADRPRCHARTRAGTIASITVLGALQASAEVKAALADRITNLDWGKERQRMDDDFGGHAPGRAPTRACNPIEATQIIQRGAWPARWWLRCRRHARQPARRPRLGPDAEIVEPRGARRQPAAGCPRTGAATQAAGRSITRLARRPLRPGGTARWLDALLPQPAPVPEGARFDDAHLHLRRRRARLQALCPRRARRASAASW